MTTARVLAALLLLVVATGCERRTSVRSEATLKLERCRLPGVSVGLHCGTLEVFEDRAAKTGRTLKLHVAVAKALAPNPEPDPVFILAGGPGQAASDTAALLLPQLERVRRSRDIVFLDQRGTGKSHPLSCDLDAPEATLAERLRAEWDPEDVRRCVAELSKVADLRHYTTEVAMKDLDEVRAALGYERINLWGGSYGTRAGLVYLRGHPERVRTAVLDGVAPMQLVLPADIPADADRALRLLFDHCAKDPVCGKTYPELSARFAALLESLEKAPAQVTLPHPVTGAPTEVEIGREAFVRTLRALLYQAEATTLVPYTIDRASNGDFRPLLAQSELVTSGFSRGMATGMFLSVVCSEDVPFITPTQLSAAGEGTFVGGGLVTDIVRACELWPKGKVEATYREPVTSEVPVLLLSGELDPVTPPRWGELALKTLTHAKHAVIPGTGHGTLATACGRRLVEKFIAQGSLQGIDVTCEGVSRPAFFTSFAGPPP